MLEFTLFLMFVVVVVWFNCYYLSRKTNSHLHTSLLLYTFIGQCLSVAYVELFPVYITESGITSFDIGARYRVLPYFLLIFASSYITAAFLEEKFGSKQFNIRLRLSNEYGLVLYLFIGVLGLQYANLLLSRGTPLFDANVTRWNYWTSYAYLPILERLFGTLMTFVPLPLLIISLSTERARTRVVAIVLFVAYVLYLVLTGQRVSGFIWLICLLYPSYIIIRGSNSNVRLIHKGILVPVVILLLIAVWGYISRMENSGTADTVGGGAELVKYRYFVLNGHVYWNMDRLADYRGYLSPRVSDFLNGSESVRAAIGGALGKSFIRQGVNYTGCFPGISVYVFGKLLTVPIVVFFGIILGVVNYMVFVAVKTKSAILAIPLSYVWLWSYGMISNGSATMIFNGKYAFMFFAAVAYVAFNTKKICHTQE